MIDKSRFIEGLIETVLIPGKLEEFTTQISVIPESEIGQIYGDESLTSLLKDIIREKEVTARIAKVRILRDAVRASSVLYSDESFGEGNLTKAYHEPVKTHSLPNAANAGLTANSIINPLKEGTLEGMLINQGRPETVGLVQAAAGRVLPASDAKFSQGTNFAGGPGITVTPGPSVSSVPASVPADSNHTSVFAENINVGDVYNGRKVNAVTEEISPVDGSTLYSIELDDRSIVKASAGSSVTFSNVIRDIVNHVDHTRSNNMNRDEVGNFSIDLAIKDFKKGLRTYSEQFSTILDYHTSTQSFDSDEYLLAFDELEKIEENDPMNQLNNKIEAINSKLDNIASFDDEDEDLTDDEIDSDDYAEFENELEEDLTEEAFSDFIGRMDNLSFDEETGMVFGSFGGDTFVFNDEAEEIMVLNPKTQQLELFANYDELSLPEESVTE